MNRRLIPWLLVGTMPWLLLAILLFSDLRRADTPQTSTFSPENLGEEGASPTFEPLAIHPQSTPPPTTQPVSLAPGDDVLAVIREGDIFLINLVDFSERRLNLSNVRRFAWISANEMDVVTNDKPERHLLVSLQGQVQELNFPAGSFARSIDGVGYFSASGSWSKDGRQYAVPTGDSVAIYDRSGSQIRRLQFPSRLLPENCPIGPNPLVLGPPIFHPGGNSVLVSAACEKFAGSGGLLAKIYELPLDGSSPRAFPSEALTNFRGLEGIGPRFSPDGSHFAQETYGRAGACSMGVSLVVSGGDGSNARTVDVRDYRELLQQMDRNDLIGGVAGFDWSPDGRLLTVGFAVSFCEGNSIRTAFAGLYTWRIEDSYEEKLLDSSVAQPLWSPSGRYIAYRLPNNTDRLPCWPIQVLDLRTKQLTQVTPGILPSWRPH